MGVFNLLVGLYGIFIVDNMEYSLCIIFQGLMFCAFGLNLMDDSLECHQCSSWAAPWSPLTHRYVRKWGCRKAAAGWRARLCPATPSRALACTPADPSAPRRGSRRIFTHGHQKKKEAVVSPAS
jgi:hypothetical protein